ncbi:MAG: hexose kinase [Clostridia bacterium]|nr:hexose kinase [Clostridia bacterium]
MKIITVTLNPCTDVDYRLSSPFRAGELNRVPSPRVSVCGKGINVSRALLGLGRDSVAMGIFGSDGAEESLRAEGLDVVAVNCRGNLRRNTSIIDSNGAQTQINEPGIYVSEEKLREFIGLYKSELNCQGGCVVVLSGSIPPGVPADIYRKLCTIARNAGAYVILDCDGNALKEGMESIPDLIKPNREEFEEINGKPLSGSGSELRENAAGEALRFHLTNHSSVLLTLGEDGSVYAGPEGCFLCEARKADIKTFKGAGDSFLASFILHHVVEDKDCEMSLILASVESARYLSADVR